VVVERVTSIGLDVAFPSLATFGELTHPSSRLDRDESILGPEME
jgi:hypothetical protein